VTDTEARVVEAWNEAAADLGIRFVSPYVARSTSGLSHEYLGLVQKFGGRNGMLVRVMGEPSEDSPDPIGDGYYWSILSSSYTRYDRQLFIDTLDDWKYFGPESERPEWYTGKS
jgi:hypothetical protein